MTRPIAFTLLASVFLACGSEDSGVTATAVRTEIDTVRGTERILNTGVPSTWHLEKLLTLGSVGTLGQAAPDEFALVTSAIWGPHDRVYVADARNAEVKVFELDGSLALRFGRNGEGPGEFGGLYSLAWVGDNLFALDFGVGRVAVFDAQGQWLGQRRHPGGISSSSPVLRLYQTDDNEAYAWALHPTPSGSRRIFVRHTPEAAMDTLLQLTPDEEHSQYLECNHPSGVIGVFDIPFAPRFLQHPAQDQLLAVVETDRYQIAYLNSNGDTVRIVDRAIEPVPTNAAEWDDGLREYHEFRERFSGASCEPSLSQRPEVQPPVRDMLIDPSGRLWVEVITLDGLLWEVYDPPGTLVGRIPAFPRSKRTVPYFSERHIVAVSTDSLDVQSVTVYEFHR